jgi:hypothetical protein
VIIERHAKPRQRRNRLIDARFRRIAQDEQPQERHPALIESLDPGRSWSHLSDRYAQRPASACFECGLQVPNGRSHLFDWKQLAVFGAFGQVHADDRGQQLRRQPNSQRQREQKRIQHRFLQIHIQREDRGQEEQRHLHQEVSETAQPALEFGLWWLNV